MYADSAFSELCPGIDYKEWCLSPPSNGTCCFRGVGGKPCSGFPSAGGICPNIGVSGLTSHISLAFSALSSIAAIALSPSSSPSVLTTSLIQTDAYAISLLWYLLSDSSGLDYFHAAYMLLLALASVIPLSAVATSPPWAITGQKSPAEREADAKGTMLDMLKGLEEGGEESRPLRGRKLKRLKKAIKNNPEVVYDALGLGQMGIPASHWMLYISCLASFILWAGAFLLGVYGGAARTTKVSLAQPNCTEGLGNVATYILWADGVFLVIAVLVFIGIVISHLMDDIAKKTGRVVLTEYNGSPRLVFGVSFIIYLLWMVTSFWLWFSAGATNLLAAGEFSFSVSTMFSVLMLVVPIYSVFKALWANR
ncbi:hypothetical protein JCM10207_004913 [Rhodosporidiobolus poonsookiae]